jgi:hypothetical protein
MVNEQLRYAIRVLKGGGFKTFPRNRFIWVLGVIEGFEKEGWVWQAKILRSHLHRFLQASKKPDFFLKKKDIIGC